MKITLLGNCQTRALTWYIQQINVNYDVKWVCIERLKKMGGGWLRSGSGDKFIGIISDTREAINRLKLSDYVIFQHIRPETSENYNVDQIKKHAKNAELISISSFLYKPDDPEQKSLKGMIERAEEFNIDIPAHKIIEKHGVKIDTQKRIINKRRFQSRIQTIIEDRGCEIIVKQGNHPKVFYFLELVREICELTGWEYYNDEQYNQYLKDGYPFG